MVGLQACGVWTSGGRHGRRGSHGEGRKPQWVTIREGGYCRLWRSKEQQEKPIKCLGMITFDEYSTNGNSLNGGRSHNLDRFAGRKSVDDVP